MVLVAGLKTFVTVCVTASVLVKKKNPESDHWFLLPSPPTLYRAVALLSVARLLRKFEQVSE